MGIGLRRSGEGRRAASGAGRGNSRILLFAGAAIGGLVLGGWMLLGSTGSDELAGPDGVATTRSATAPSASASAAATAAARQVTASPSPSRVAHVPDRAQVSARDPFAPIVEPKVTDSPTTGGAGDPSSPSPTPTPTPTPASGGTISLLRISPAGNALTLELDGKKYSVAEGETFARSYRLYDIFNSNCAGFLYGDQNAVVCLGDEVAIG